MIRLEGNKESVDKSEDEKDTSSKNELGKEPTLFCKRLVYRDWTDGFGEKELFGIVEQKLGHGIYFRTTGVKSNKRYFIRNQDFVSLKDTDIIFEKHEL